MRRSGSSVQGGGGRGPLPLRMMWHHPNGQGMRRCRPRVQGCARLALDEAKQVKPRLPTVIKWPWSHRLRRNPVIHQQAQAARRNHGKPEICLCHHMTDQPGQYLPGGDRGAVHPLVRPTDQGLVGRSDLPIPGERRIRSGRDSWRRRAIRVIYLSMPCGSGRCGIPGGAADGARPRGSHTRERRDSAAEWARIPAVFPTSGGARCGSSPAHLTEEVPTGAQPR